MAKKNPAGKTESAGMTIKTAPGPPQGRPETEAAAEGNLATDPLPTVKVNNAHLQEIKSALDDAVKKHLESLSFTPSLFHPTVHLSLGYTSVLLAIGSYLYSLKVDFETSKPTLWVGVGGYFALQAVLWCWKRWVEQGQVFSGKRRRMVKRIETDIVQITTSTTLDPPPQPSVTFSPHTRPSSPTSAPSSPSSSSSHVLPPAAAPPTIIIPPPSSSSTPSSSALGSGSGKHTDGSGPTYLLHLTLSTTSNNGKSLLHKARIASGRYVGEFVDQEGGVEEGEVTRWVGGLLAEAGLAGAEDEGIKNE